MAQVEVVEKTKMLKVIVRDPVYGMESEVYVTIVHDGKGKLENIVVGGKELGRGEIQAIRELIDGGVIKF